MTTYGASRVRASLFWLPLGLVVTGLDILGVHTFLSSEHAGPYLYWSGIAAPVFASAIPFGVNIYRLGRLATGALYLMMVACMGFTVWSAIARTGSAADTFAAQQQKIAIATETARKAEREAEAQLVLDRRALADCDGCKRARDALASTQRRLDASREIKLNVVQDDPLIHRMAALFHLPEDTVRTYQPMYLPVLMCLLGPLFMYAGTHKSGETKPETKPGTNTPLPERDKPRDKIRDKSPGRPHKKGRVSKETLRKREQRARGHLRLVKS